MEHALHRKFVLHLVNVVRIIVRLVEESRQVIGLFAAENVATRILKFVATIRVDRKGHILCAARHAAPREIFVLVVNVLVNKIILKYTILIITYMKNKKLLILSVVGVVILFVFMALIISQFNSNKSTKPSPDPLVDNNGEQAAPFEPEFLTPEEKQSFNIPADFKAQAIKRGDNGEVMVYKLIRSDSDVVDPAKIGPISPRTK